MKRNVLPYLPYLFALLCFVQCKAQQTDNWTKEQLMEPASLAERIRANEKLPLIYSVGPAVVIPGSVDIGMTRDKQNVEKFRKEIEKLPRDSELVIYCGCCPFEHCPNVRPALALLQEMKFTNYHLLNLPHNIRTDWIAKGYPEIKAP